MDCVIFFLKKHILSSDIMSDNPYKKLRLDLQNANHENAGNEDLWGQDDLTAEEFDMLEIQATQSCIQNAEFKEPNHSRISVKPNFIEVEDLKQLQFELEGRIKLLSDSLEKSAKELNEERLNREQLIRERIKEFSEREVSLKKEVERMQSILEFKDQEMKSTYSKVQMMKSQLQNKKNCVTETTMNSNFQDFLNRSKTSPIKFPKFQKFQRKHKLVIDAPRGEIKGVDILSSILFSRFAFPSPNHEKNINSTFSGNFSSNLNYMPASVVKLKNEQKSDELLNYYDSFLRNHIVLLKTLASKNSAASCYISSPKSSKCKEAGYSCTVISYLCDIALIFCCPKTNPYFKNDCNNSENQSHENEIPVTVKSSCSPVLNDGDVNTSISTLAKILESLCALVNPKTYPNGYSKSGEMEFSLSALLAISMSNPQRFLDLIGELPIYSFLNPVQNATALCITLKLLITLCCCENLISFLIHKNDRCTFCLIAALLTNVVPRCPENFAVFVTLVEDFLSMVFTSPNFAQTLFETSECISEVIQSIIVSMLKYFQMREKVSLSMVVIKKGFLLLHYISSSIPNFKERRHPVENEYISLISGILLLSKENVELREFYDLIHSLWDFQTDITEFDLEDLSEETQASTNDMEIDK